MTEQENARTTHGIIPLLFGLVVLPIPLAVIVAVMRATEGLSNEPIRSWLIDYLMGVVLPFVLIVAVFLTVKIAVRRTEDYIRG